MAWHHRRHHENRACGSIALRARAFVAAVQSRTYEDIRLENWATLLIGG